MATKEELEQQLAVARKDIETLAAMAGNTARQQLEAGVESAQTYVNDLSEEARQVFDQARAEGARLRKATENQIHANPFASVGIAFVVGVVLAGLLGRR